MLDRDTSHPNDGTSSHLSYPGSGFRQSNWMSTGTGVGKPPLLPLAILRPPKVLSLQSQLHRLKGLIRLHRGDDRQHGTETELKRTTCCLPPNAARGRLDITQKRSGACTTNTSFPKVKSGNFIAFLMLQYLPHYLSQSGQRVSFCSCRNEGSDF